MIDPQMELLSTVVLATIARLGADPDDSAAWLELQEALALTGEKEAELVEAIEGRDLQALAALAEAWRSGKKYFPVCDREVLKRAMKAFRKSLKVTILANESSLGGGPLSSGRASEIVGIQPPRRYPPAVWQELARQGRLKADRGGTYELGEGQ